MIPVRIKRMAVKTRQWKDLFLRYLTRFYHNPPYLLFFFFYNFFPSFFLPTPLFLRFPLHNPELEKMHWQIEFAHHPSLSTHPPERRSWQCLLQLWLFKGSKLQDVRSQDCIILFSSHFFFSYKFV